MKRKYIIYFLSAIFLFLIATSNASALGTDIDFTDYKYNGIVLPDVREIPDFQTNVDKFTLMYDPFNNSFFVNYINARNQFPQTQDFVYYASGGCTKDDFPSKVNSGCSSWSRGWYPVNTLYTYGGSYYCRVDSTTNLCGAWTLDSTFSGTGGYVSRDVATYIYSNSAMNIYQGRWSGSYLVPSNSTIQKTLPAGFFVETTPNYNGPYIEYLNSEYFYNSDNVYTRKMNFVIRNFSTDYYYTYDVSNFDPVYSISSGNRIYSFDDYVSSEPDGFFSIDTTSNIRLYLNVVNSEDQIVSTTTQVVADFTFDNYNQYFFDDSNAYYFVSGFTSDLNEFAISRFLPNSYIHYHDFTLGIAIEDVTLSSHECRSSNPGLNPTPFSSPYSYLFCYDFNPSVDLANFSYNSNHTYGIRIDNYYVLNYASDYSINNVDQLLVTCSNVGTCPVGISSFIGSNLGTNITKFAFSINRRRDFFVYNTLTVSYTGSYDKDSGIVSNITYNYVDTSGVTHTDSSIDTSISNFELFTNSITQSYSTYSNVFEFFTSGFTFFYTSLSSPLIYAWAFCFSLVIIGLCIKIWL